MCTRIKTHTPQTSANIQKKPHIIMQTTSHKQSTTGEYKCVYTHACVCVWEHIFMRKCSSHLVTRAGLCRQPPPKKKTYCINLQVPHHRQCAKHTQDTRGTSSTLPLYTRQVWDKFSFTTTHKCGTSSPLSLHPRQKWDKFSFTTTHKTSAGQVLLYHHTEDKCGTSYYYYWLLLYI